MSRWMTSLAIKLWWLKEHGHLLRIGCETIVRLSFGEVVVNYIVVKAANYCTATS